MKLYKIIFILIVFFKTETLFSDNNLFSVNNVEIEKKDKITNDILANRAIKKGFNQLLKRILLTEDVNRLSDLKFSNIKELVIYYQITNTSNDKKEIEKINYNVTFDKNRIHNLFYKRGILYSEITDKELYILPLLIKDNKVFIFNNNYFYKNWNVVYKNELIEFILPQENIEIIQYINFFKENLIKLEIVKIFQEYLNKNIALILIDDNKSNNGKVFIKTLIQGKKISKSFNLKKNNLNTNMFYNEIIINTKKQLIDLVKSKNLVDISTPFFLNVKLNLNRNSNLAKLNLRIKKIDSIENIYVQEFNKDYVSLRIKYLGKLDNIITQLKKENIDLRLINDLWVIKTL